MNRAGPFQVCPGCGKKGVKEATKSHIYWSLDCRYCRSHRLLATRIGSSPEWTVVDQPWRFTLKARLAIQQRQEKPVDSTTSDV